jgi:hypothetical protein
MYEKVWPHFKNVYCKNQYSYKTVVFTMRKRNCGSFSYATYCTERRPVDSFPENGIQPPQVVLNFLRTLVNDFVLAIHPTQPSADWMPFSRHLPTSLRDLSDIVQFWRMRTYMCPRYNTYHKQNAQGFFLIWWKLHYCNFINFYNTNA